MARTTATNRDRATNHTQAEEPRQRRAGEAARRALRAEPRAEPRATERVARQMVREEVNARGHVDAPRAAGVRLSGTAEALRPRPVTATTAALHLKRFNQARDGAAFAQLVQSNPRAAARWLYEIAEATGQSRISKVLEPLLRRPKTTDAHFQDALTPLVGKVSGWIDKAKGHLNATAETIGIHELIENPTQIPVFQGKLFQDGDVYRLRGNDGKIYDLASNGQGYPSAINPTDYLSLSKHPISIRGWLQPVAGLIEPNGTKTAGVITISEAIPGLHDDFVSGRVSQSEVAGHKRWGIQTERGFVEFPDAQWRELLPVWEEVGLGIPGHVDIERSEKYGTRLIYRGAPPEEVMVLTALGNNGDVASHVSRVDKSVRAYRAITPSPEDTATPTLIVGPKATHPDDYIRRLVIGKLVTPRSLARHVEPGTLSKTKRAVKMTAFFDPVPSSRLVYQPELRRSIGALLTHLPAVAPESD